MRWIGIEAARETFARTVKKTVLVFFGGTVILLGAWYLTFREILAYN